MAGDLVLVRGRNVDLDLAAETLSGMGHLGVLCMGRGRVVLVLDAE